MLAPSPLPLFTLSPHHHLPSRVDDNLNIGDAIDYGQHKHSGSLGDLVLATLRRLEQSGGPGEGGREGRPSANSAFGYEKGCTEPGVLCAACVHGRWPMPAQQRQHAGMGRLEQELLSRCRCVVTCGALRTAVFLQTPTCTSSTMWRLTKALCGPAGWRASHRRRQLEREWQQRSGGDRQLLSVLDVCFIAC